MYKTKSKKVGVKNKSEKKLTKNSKSHYPSTPKWGFVGGKENMYLKSVGGGGGKKKVGVQNKSEKKIQKP